MYVAIAPGVPANCIHVPNLIKSPVPIGICNNLNWFNAKPTSIEFNVISTLEICCRHYPPDSAPVPPNKISALVA